MKKLLAVLIVLCKTRIEIGAFFQRNGPSAQGKNDGNRVNIDMMDGFMLHLNQIFDKNIIIPVPTKGPDKVKQVKPNANRSGGGGDASPANRPGGGGGSGNK